MSPKKETRFFDVKYEKGIDFYKEEFFSGVESEKILGEATATYSFLPFVAQRIKEHFPNAKFIFIRRDPIERAYSEWLMRTSLGNETLGFKEALLKNAKQSQNSFQTPNSIKKWKKEYYNLQRGGGQTFRVYIKGGLLSQQVKTYYNIFSEEQVLIIDFKEIRNKLNLTSKKIFNFLGVNDKYEVQDQSIKNPYSIKKKLHAKVISLLGKKEAQKMWHLLPKKLRGTVMKQLNNIKAQKPPLSKKEKIFAKNLFSNFINKNIDMLNGLMTNPATPTYNIGDYIQTIAAKQFFSEIDILVDRERLKDYNSKPVKMIMNGWYMHQPEQWPPSKEINPLFISFHINENVKDKMLNQNGIDYLKRHEPIGCRDWYTESVLKERGIDAYYSGCLTITLDEKYKTDKKTTNIYFVDPIYKASFRDHYMLTTRKFVTGIKRGAWYKLAGKKRKALNAIFTKSLQKKATPIPHMYKAPSTEKERFKLADSLLRKYAEAKMVVTSRIHCALPCLAMETPVIFLNYGFDSRKDLCRFEGITELFNTVNIDNNGNVEANFDYNELIDQNFDIQNPTNHLKYSKKLRQKCYDFTKG